jgi:hypothetical protein
LPSATDLSAHRDSDLVKPGRIILTSGYSAELMNQADVARLDLQVLRKPYRQAELARAFRAALADRSRPAGSGR